MDILEEFKSLGESHDEKELWKVNSIIKLMNFSKGTNDKELIKSGLLVILFLCNNKIHQMEERNGKDIKELLKQERNSLITLLENQLS